MSRHIHLIFDLGGTLIFDPFDQTILRISTYPLREKLAAGLSPEVIDDFVEQWKRENAEYNFSFASHFLQEEVWITRAAWPAYQKGKVVSKTSFPTWAADILSTYRATALDVIAGQSHLADLRHALDAAKKRGYLLSVASNDRFFATSAMLGAAGILHFFDAVVTSEGLNFTTAGAEKPSRTFFEAVQATLGLDFEATNTFYIGDDEMRDIRSTQDLPIKSVRFFGNRSTPKSWLDNPVTTQANLHYSDYIEFTSLVQQSRFEE